MKFRLWGSFLGVMVLFVVGMVPSASANHPTNSCIDLEPEVSSNEVGTDVILTATLRTGTQENCTGAALTPDNGTVQVNFEISGPNAVAGTPDMSCSIKPNDTSCTVEHQAVTAGTDMVVGWIDHDKDDVLDQGEPSDSVTVTWSAPANTLDCDDQTGPDFERETNVGSSGAASSEIYTCTATTAGGVLFAGAVVSAEVENGVNDPDATDGASHASPDYSCTTGTGGTCQITVTQVEGELGTASICFWVGAAAQGVTLCMDEKTDENQRTDESDAGNDYADRVEKTWVASVTARLDCTPEGAYLGTTAPHTITCQATDATGGNVEGAQIDVEIIGANDSDGDTPTTPDLTCTTGSNGRCSVTHNSTGATGGISVYRAWIDADLSNTTVEADLSEGTVESTSPGAEAEADDTDVVERSWDPEPPPPPATCPGYEGGSRNHVVGTINSEVLVGTDGRDVICGFRGNDTISGFADNDVLLGGRGSDVLRGGRGNDLVKGGSGNDTLYGGGGDDDLRGGRGVDFCHGGPGRDTRRSC